MLYTENKNEVPATSTKAQAELVVRMFVRSILDMMSEGDLEGLSQAQIVNAASMLAAQSSFETGAWQKCWCWNMVNLKSNTTHIPHCYLRNVWEIDGNGEKVVLQPPAVGTRFRAYGSLAEGARAAVEFFAVDTDGDGMNAYADAWDAACSGEPERYCSVLKDKRYFTGNVDLYEGRVGSGFHLLRTDITEQVLDEELSDRGGVNDPFDGDDEDEDEDEDENDAGHCGCWSPPLDEYIRQMRAQAPAVRDLMGELKPPELPRWAVLAEQLFVRLGVVFVPSSSPHSIVGGGTSQLEMRPVPPRSLIQAARRFADELDDELQREEKPSVDGPLEHVRKTSDDHWKRSQRRAAKE